MNLEKTTNLIAAQAETLTAIRQEVNKVIVGQEKLIDRLIVALITGGHILLEGVPGLAKTLSVKTLADALGLQFQRISFTPDLLPADVIGTMIYNPKDATFTPKKGPVFTNLLLADEINRAPAKVQSALLEAMQERQVTIGEHTYTLPAPFLVMATQNPIETEGTYPLPEAQVDRFMMKVLVDYPTPEEEFVIAERVTGEAPVIGAIATTEQLAALQIECRKGFVEPALMQYAVRLVCATRQPAKYGLPEFEPWITFGASPRATINLVEGARALAFLRGRDYVLPEDMTELVPDVLRHRLVLSYQALAEGMTADAIIAKLMQHTPAPVKALESHVQAS